MKIVGLLSRPELNGARAVVVGFVPRSGRYGVRVESSDWAGEHHGGIKIAQRISMQLKPENLVLWDGNGLVYGERGPVSDRFQTSVNIVGSAQSMSQCRICGGKKGLVVRKWSDVWKWLVDVVGLCVSSSGAERKSSWRTDDHTSGARRQWHNC